MPVVPLSPESLKVLNQNSRQISSGEELVISNVPVKFSNALLTGFIALLTEEKPVEPVNLQVDKSVIACNE